MAPSHCHTAQSQGWVSRVKNDTHTAGPMLQILSSSSIRLQQGSEHVTAAVLTRQVTEGQSTGESGGGRGTSVYCLFCFLKVKQVCLLILVIGLFSLYGDP